MTESLQRPFIRGARLGVDVGEVRVGIAISDPDGILATPLVTLRRDRTATKGRVPGDMAEIARLIQEHECVEVVVGLPKRLSGDEGFAASGVRAYAEQLNFAIQPVPISFSDERMSTVVAARRLAERGVRGKRQRAVVDQAAAVEILQGWLDTHRRHAMNDGPR